VDALIEQESGTTDNDKRYALQAQAMSAAMKDYPVLPLHLQSLTMAASKDLVPTIYINERTIADGVHNRH